MTDGVPGGAEGPGSITQFRRDDPGTVAAGAPFKLIETDPQGAKEQGTGLGNATADHDNFRIENINETGHGGPQGSDRPLPNLAR